MKTYTITPNRTCISVFLRTVLHCFHSEHEQVEGVRSEHEGSLRYEEIGQTQTWYVILKGENQSFHLNINYRPHLKTSKIIPNRTCISLCLHTVLHCFHSEHEQVEGVRSETRRLFKVLKNYPNSKLIFYSERGEPKLSFEYKFVGHTWKLLKLCPTVHAYLFFYTLYCIVSTENTGKLKECEVHTEAL